MTEERQAKTKSKKEQLEEKFSVAMQHHLNVLCYACSYCKLLHEVLSVFQRFSFFMLTK